MKKALLFLISIMVIGSFANSVMAKPAVTNSKTASAIKLYKSGDYTKSYVAFSDIISKDPSNALAYYYLGMASVQLGKKEEAIENYNKAIDLSPNGVLGSYAKKGVRCIEEPVACHASSKIEEEDLTPEDRFIKGSFGSGFSQKARSVHEKEKIENIKREINRNNEIAPQQFKEYRDFSSYAPTNDEIVNALRVLKAAGLSDMVNIGGRNAELQSLLGSSSKQSGTGYDMLDLMFSNNQNGKGLSPEAIQALMTSQMTASF